MTKFKLRLREDRPATIEEHRELRDKIATLKTLCEDAIIKLRLSSHPSDWQLADQMEEEINK